MRNVISPKSERQSRRFPEPPPWGTTRFDLGILRGPASTLPPNAVYDGLNIIVVPEGWYGRTGCRLITEAPIPPIPTTGCNYQQDIVASKALDVITATANVFTEADVSNYFVWPGSPQQHDEIMEYLAPNMVRVARSGSIDLVARCYIRGKTNIFDFHRVQKRWIFQWGREFYYSEVPMAAFNRIICISRDEPNNAISTYQDFDEYSGYVWNSNGQYTINLEPSLPVAYKRNTQIPHRRIDDQTVETACNYRYLYAAARLSGFGYFLNRLEETRIELQTGTNNWDTALRDYADVFTARPIDENHNCIVGPLYVPQVQNTFPVEYEWHFTHFPIFRILDRLARYRGVLNDENRYVWVKDLRVAGAFFAHKLNGVIEAARGEFEPADIGSVVLWENGDRDEIIGYINSTHVLYSTDRYYRDWNPWMACAIGNGRVMRASQTEDIVTRTHGRLFRPTDERKTIWHSDGYRSYIRCYIDQNTVRVWDSTNREIEGITIDPVYRYFNDTTSDEQLRTRTKWLTCQNRNWEPIRNSNIGAIAPGFVLAGRRGEGDLHYGQISDGYEYFAGFHNRGYQISRKIKDGIYALIVTPDRFVALCDNRCWYGDTNRAEFITLPQIKEAIAYLTGIDTLEGDIGCFDWGSIAQIEKGVYMMITAEPGGVGLRKFDGYQFGPNLIEVKNSGLDRYGKEFRDLQQAVCSINDGFMGYIVWGKNKPGVS